MSHIAFLCFPCCTHHFPVFQSIFWYFPVPNGYALRLIYIDAHLVLYLYVQISTLTMFSLSLDPGHFRHQMQLHNLIPVYCKYLTSIIWFPGLWNTSVFQISIYLEILLACLLLTLCSLLSGYAQFRLVPNLWMIIEILGPAIVVGAVQSWSHCLKPLWKTDFWPSSAVHSLVTTPLI